MFAGGGASPFGLCCRGRLGERGSPFGLCCRRCWGAGVGWVGWYGLLTPPRPPPPVILPGAAFASLCLAGASRRASPFGLALPPAGGGEVWAPVSVWRGAEKTASWGGVDVRVTIGKTATRSDWREFRGDGLRGPGSQVPPTTSASRAVRRNPVSAFFRAPVRHCCNSVSKNA